VNQAFEARNAVITELMSNFDQLVLRNKQMIQIIVMAGLVPAIHVYASHRGARCGCVDARIKPGYDE
jgi:hypothetical protein